MSELFDDLVEKATADLLGSDAITANTDGSPTFYWLDAENVQYLVRTVLEAIGLPALLERVEAARMTTLQEAAVALEAKRLHNPMNGDGSNLMLDKAIKALDVLAGDDSPSIAAKVADAGERIAQAIEAACPGCEMAVECDYQKAAAVARSALTEETVR